MFRVGCNYLLVKTRSFLFTYNRGESVNRQAGGAVAVPWYLCRGGDTVHDHFHLRETPQQAPGRRGNARGS